MDKNDILNYVTKTPGNTNRAVLGGMLDSFAGSGGGGSDALVVTFTPSEDFATAEADKTYSEIMTALNAGQVVIGKMEISAADTNLFFDVKAILGGGINFVCDYIDAQDMFAFNIIMGNDSFCTIHMFSISITPAN